MLFQWQAWREPTSEKSSAQNITIETQFSQKKSVKYGIRDSFAHVSLIRVRPWQGTLLDMSYIIKKEGMSH